MNVNSTISQIETGLALVTGCVPEILPLMRFLMPSFFNLATRKSTNPAQYLYPPTIGSKKNSRGQSANDDNILKDTVYEEYGLEDLKLRPNNGLVQRETHVRGAASTDSLTGSQIEVFGRNPEEKSESTTITKTTHFSVRESDSTDPKRTWSNV